MGTKNEQACPPDAKKMEALARFSGKLAHDMNNILGAIEGYSTLVSGAMRTDDPAKEDMEEIRQAVAKAAGLMKKFLVFSGRSGFTKTACDVGALLAGLGQKAAAEREDVKLELDIRPGLPVISADASGLEQALQHLLQNAREALPGGGTIVLRAEALRLPPGEIKSPRPAEAGSDFVKISVEDTGPGMPAEVRERLFEPFFTTKKYAKGAGLGLSAVYGIAAYHNGWVEVKSGAGPGSEFLLVLPAKPGAADLKKI